VHGIVIIEDGCCDDVGARFIAPQKGRPQKGAINCAPTLGKIIRSFKGKTAFLLRKGFPQFAGQRNYHERVIRNEKELSQVREYIMNNPLQWASDEENPKSRHEQIISVDSV